MSNQFKKIPTALFAVVFLCSGLVSAPILRAQGAGDVSKVEVLATLPEPPESMTELPDGSIVITQNKSGTLRRLKKDNQVEDFVTLPMHPVGVIAIDQGFLITADNRPVPVPATPPPPNSPVDVGTEVVLLDKTGKVVKHFPGAPGQFFNGITQAGNLILVADTSGGTIWQLDLKSDKGMQPWLKDETLLPAPPPARGPGSNGIKYRDGWVYVAHTSRATIYRIAIDDMGRPKGGLEAYSPIPGPDDFDVSKDGTIYALSGQSMMKIPQGGAAIKFLSPVQGGPYSLVTHDQKWIYWGTRGAIPGTPPPPEGQPVTQVFRILRYPLN